MSDILSRLNKAQQEAATATEGPVLIIAGAGSGKTRALTHRIAYLISQGVRPENILALTFTNKAADEMRSRVFKLLSLQVDKPNPDSQTYKLADLQTNLFVGTFHSFAAKVLRREIGRLGRGRDFVIYDESDSLALIKETLMELAADPERFKPAGIRAAISKQKNELVDAAQYQEEAKEFYEKTVANVFIKYTERLAEANAADFDDLLLLAVGLFQKFPETLAKYQDRFKYILVDEYQDTNRAQYVFLKLLAQKHKNLCVVGDDWQCFTPQTKILTDGNQKPINRLTAGENVISANGAGTIKNKVSKIKKFNYSGEIFKITTSRGTVIRTTPNHVFFTRLKLDPNIYFVYLMFSSFFGYRIGIAKGARSDGKKVNIGLRVRANQERADKMWILKVVPNRAEALFFEHLYSTTYSIPTMVFSAAKNRSMKISQTLINRLYKTIPTRENAENMMNKLRLSQEYPHFLPQGTTRKNSNIQKIRINLCLFGDPRIGQSSPWGFTRLTINTSNNGLRKALIRGGWPIRKGKLGTWRLEYSRRNYAEAENIARQIRVLAENLGVPLEICRSIFLKQGFKRYQFQPASHLRPTMLLPVVKNGLIQEEEITDVKTESYHGPVYDLEVANTHNYIANGIVVHNSIYSFRGADFTNILSFEKDYPQAKVVLLEENYRSSQNILDAAHGVIEKNIYKTQKRLWTQKAKGDKITLVEADNETEEALFVTAEIKKLLGDRQKNYDLNDFVVLYRTNAQSRALEEAVVREGWPYRLVGAVKFYERREVKDIVCYLRVIQNGQDMVGLKRIINVPPRGIGKATWEKVYSAGDLAAINHPKVETFLKLIAELRREAQEKNLPELLQTLLAKIQYQNYCLDGTEEGRARFENVLELVTAAQKFKHLEPPLGLAAFLEELALTAAADDVSDETGCLNLMTLHSAKGLEFAAVFIAGAEEGLLPHSRSFFNSAEMEEERRLCYVGLTRAKDKAYFLFTRRRNIYGESKPASPSRFLEDIPAHLVEFREYDAYAE